MAQEKNFENKIKALLKERGAWFVKYWAGAQFTKSGIPDILCCYNGAFIGIEIKAENGKPSMLQIQNLKKINAAGGIGVLLYPCDINYFEKLLDDIDRPHWSRIGAQSYFKEVLETYERKLKYGN